MICKFYIFLHIFLSYYLVISYLYVSYRDLPSLVDITRSSCGGSVSITMLGPDHSAKLGAFAGRSSRDGTWGWHSLWTLVWPISSQNITRKQPLRKAILNDDDNCAQPSASYGATSNEDLTTHGVQRPAALKTPCWSTIFAGHTILGLHGSYGSTGRNDYELCTPGRRKPPDGAHVEECLGCNNRLLGSN